MNESWLIWLVINHKAPTLAGTYRAFSQLQEARAYATTLGWKEEGLSLDFSSSNTHMDGRVHVTVVHVPVVTKGHTGPLPAPVVTKGRPLSTTQA